MDFNIQAKDNKLLIRVKPCEKSNVELFCIQYKTYLNDAKHNKKKLKVLFDLRLASINSMIECRPRLQPFFSQEIQKLSEESLESSIVVVPNQVVEQTIRMIFNLCPGSVPTIFTTTFPGNRSTNPETGG